MYVQDGEARSPQQLGIIPQTETCSDDLNKTQLLVHVPADCTIFCQWCSSETPNHIARDLQNMHWRGKLVRGNDLESWHQPRLTQAASMSPSAWCMSRKARICRAGSVRNAEVSIICRWFTKRRSIGIEICPNKKMKIHMRDMFLKDHPKIYVMTVYLSQTHNKL